MQHWNAGDEITINGKVKYIGYGTQVDPTLLWVQLKSGAIIRIQESDINTVHPYKEPSKEDMRKGN